MEDYYDDEEYGDLDYGSDFLDSFANNKYLLKICEVHFFLLENSY